MPYIDNYEFGKIVINGKTYTNDLIIFPDKIKANWWRKQGHLLQVEDLDEVFEEKPKLLIIGTGASGAMSVDDKTKERLKQKNIKYEILPTREACNLFNEKRNAIAALHLTC